MAENLLARRDTHPALISVDEAGRRDEINYNDLRVAAGQVAAQLLAAGVEPGDRVAGFMPNRIETVIAALGCAWIGAIWSSCSPDFGVQGVLDRFGQIEPKVLFACDGYQYNGKWIELDERIQDLHDKLRPELLVAIPGRGDTTRVRQALNCGRRRAAAAVRRAALQPSALHSLFLRHHRRAQVHRARHRRRPDPARQGAPPARRPGRRRRAVLLHHLRLDDVELAGERAADRRHPGAL
ncbi:acetoacetyl-CoA synthetase [Alcanivorax sp. 521-1]|uniref:Acetoacetyl-CoA synthetase n=1 Tax=Alloalcanivorax profundimaris TaxID=2735259 RepID=A0ABS0AMN0_9GAMM|nr:acetoacetyl-CoA synthetase [Alloalcanivorax profundimaris]